MKKIVLLFLFFLVANCYPQQDSTHYYSKDEANFYLNFDTAGYSDWSKKFEYQLQNVHLKYTYREFCLYTIQYGNSFVTIEQTCILKNPNFIQSEEQLADWFKEIYNIIKLD